MKHRTPAAGTTGAIQAIASERDRVRAFAAARRHTWIVRSLRIALPLVMLTALGAYAAPLVLSAFLKEKGVEYGSVKIDTKNLTMETPVYEGFGKDGSRFRVRAREAITDLKRSGPVKLIEIDGTLTQTTGVATNLKAVWGTYDERAEVLELYERIDIDGSTGMKARLTRATIYNKESRIVSDEPVWAQNETGTIRSRSMVLRQKENKAAFRDAVHVTLTPNPPSAALRPGDEPHAAKAAPQPRSALAMPGLAGNSGQPIDVRSEALDVDDNAKTAQFRRAVIARQGDATLEAPELDVLYEGRTALSDGASKTAPGTAGQDAAKLKLIKARGGVTSRNRDDTAVSATLDYDAAAERAVLAGDVVLTSPGDRRATADRAEFDQKRERGMLKGNVVMTSGAERRVTGDQAEFDQKADTLLVTGAEVIATQGRNILKGRRLYLDRKAGTTRLETPAEGGQPAGRISTVFYQNQPEQKPGGKPRQAEGKPQEKGPANPLAVSFKTSPDAPIEVDADVLDVFDQKKHAVFRGNVIAKQGDFIVRTVEMTAHYTGQAGLDSATMPGAGAAPAKAKAKGEKDADSAAQLTRIEARKKVVVTSTDGRTVIGDWADFDVKSNFVTVGGKVTVTGANQSTIEGPEGSRLLIDMTTVKTTFEQGTGAAPGPGAGTAPAISSSSPATSPAQGGVKVGQPQCPEGAVCTKQRFRVVLYPEQAKEKAKEAAEKLKEGWAAAAEKADGQGDKEQRKKPRTRPAEASAWDTSTSAPTGNKQ